MTYPLGWSIIPHMLIRRERWPGGYKTRASALVYPGQAVQADQPVIRLEKPDSTGSVREFPGSITPTSPPASQLAGYHAAQEHMHSHVQHINGIVVSGMRGRVVDITRRGGVIIETRAAIIQGTIGAGNQVAGILTFWNSSSPFQPSSAVLANTSKVTTLSLPIAAPTILVVPGPLNFAMLRQAMNLGVVGIVASSISSRDLEDFLGTNLIAMINSMDIELAYAPLPPLTLLLTEGLGTVAMPSRTINMLSQYQGSIVLLSGMTFIRQSIYPELIISLPVQEIQRNWLSAQPDPTLSVGSQVRICSGSYEGAIGEIVYLYIYMQTFASGVRGRAARVRLEDGSTLIMPLYLLERIG
ncbi:MAG TPA: hypothetical protein VEL49_07975 [Ktedonobacteraceae bacterium]|nr:hypothetical protein [Ktedonobacteraceae bacterium]